MRRSKPLAVVAGVAMFALAACGGGGDRDGDGGEQREFGAADEIAKNPDLAAPAAEIEGATEGGTITVHLPGDPGPTDLDPTNGWSVTGNSIQQALTSRSLTQFAKNPETGTMELVPDLATDLGTPNEDYTEWTFTIRDDATWENGETITAEEVAWGICRSMDSTEFPSGPGTEYSQQYFFGAGEYEGPYTGNDPNCAGLGRRDGQRPGHHHQDGQAVPRHGLVGLLHGHGPGSAGQGERPAGLRPEHPVERSLQGGELPFRRGARAGQERPVEPRVGPGAAPVRRQVHLQVQRRPDQGRPDHAQRQHRVADHRSPTDVGSNNYERVNSELGDRLVQQTAQCTSFLAPDYNKITDINVRKALAYAYPYEDVWLAGGEVPGVTRVPANSVMPPGMAGKHDYFADGEQFEYNPEKAKELLAEAGYENEPYPIKMIYYEVDPLAVAAQKQLVKGMEEAGFAIKDIAVQDDPYNIWTDPDNKLNKTLNLRGVNWCSDWPSGLTMVPPLLRTGATYNTAFFSEESIDDEMDAITELPLEEQADAWGALDEKIGTEYFPLIPTAFRNDAVRVRFQDRQRHW